MEHDLLSWPERGQLWLRLGIRAALLIGAILLTVFVLLPGVYMMMPFVLALLFAWALNPAVKWLKGKLSLSRKAISLAVLILALCAVGGICYGLGWALFGQLRSLFENWQGVLDSLYATLDAVGVWLRSVTQRLPAGLASTEWDLLDALSRWLRSLDLAGSIGHVAGRATDFVSAVPGFAVAAIIFLMASYLITSDYPRLRYMVTEQAPESLHRFGSQVRTVFMEAFGGYIRSQFILSAGVFVILAVGLLLIGQPYSLLLALGLAVMDFIPLIGSGTVMVPWAVIDLITADYAGAAWLMVIWGIIVLFRRVAEPKILGDQTGLSPILSLLGIYAGMKLGGVLGMVLGPVLLLVAVNLGRLGVFRPVLSDLRLCAGDISAILKGAGNGAPPGGEAPPS